MWISGQKEHRMKALVKKGRANYERVTLAVLGCTCTCGKVFTKPQRDSELHCLARAQPKRRWGDAVAVTATRAHLHVNRCAQVALDAQCGLLGLRQWQSTAQHSVTEVQVTRTPAHTSQDLGVAVAHIASTYLMKSYISEYQLTRLQQQRVWRRHAAGERAPTRATLPPQHGHSVANQW